MAGWPAHIKDFEDWTKEDVFNDREDSVIFPLRRQKLRTTSCSDTVSDRSFDANGPS